MRIEWTREQVDALRAKLGAFEDAQPTGDDEYVVDLYDADPPLSLELSLKTGLDVLAAERMAYDEALNGYYVCAPETDAQAIERALLSVDERPNE